MQVLLFIAMLITNPETKELNHFVITKIQPVNTLTECEKLAKEINDNQDYFVCADGQLIFYAAECRQQI